LQQRAGAGRRVEVAVCIAKERVETERRIIDAGGNANERVITLGGVVVRQATVLTNRSRLRRKRKAGEREQRDRGANNIRYCFHVFISFHGFCEG